MRTERKEEGAGEKPAPVLETADHRAHLRLPRCIADASLATPRFQRVRIRAFSAQIPIYRGKSDLEREFGFRICRYVYR